MRAQAKEVIKSDRMFSDGLKKRVTFAIGINP